MGWQKRKLGDLAKYINGRAFKPTEWSSEGLPIIRIQNLNKEKSSFNYCNFDVDKKYFVKNGDLLFAWSGTPDTSFGAHIWKGDDAVLNQHIFRVEPNEELVDKKFYLYALNNKVKEFVSKAHGTAGLAHITKKKFEEAEILVPPIDQQLEIVQKIEELFSELDKGIEELKTAQQQLKVYRQAVLKWAFEKPERSVVYRLADVCDFVTKGTTPPKNDLFSNRGEVPFLKVYNLTFDGSLDFTKEPTFVTKETNNVFLKRSIVVPGDVLMNIVGPPLGKVSIVPKTYPNWNINQAIVRFRCKEVLLNKYLMHFLLSDNTIRTYSRKAKATAGQFNLTLEICRDIEIPIPSIEKQIQTVQEIESRLSVCDKIEETITNSLKQAEALRQSILREAFEGKF